MQTNVALVYIGNGAFIPDVRGELVPARDLTADEVAHFGEVILLASGLYIKPAKPKTNLKSEQANG